MCHLRIERSNATLPRPYRMVQKTIACRNFCSLLSESSMRNINKKKYYKSITLRPRQISLNLSLRMVLPINPNRTVIRRQWRFL